MGLISRLFRRVSGLIHTSPSEGQEGKATLPETSSKEDLLAMSLSSTSLGQPSEQQTPSLIPHQPSPFLNEPNRKPYLVQIGFDFGTSNCKCVYRDIVTQQAWVYVPEDSVNPEYPFLLPSALQIRNGALCIADPNAHYHDNGLPHIKTALAACAREQWEDQSLLPYRKALNGDSGHLIAFVSACTVYLLAGYFGNIRKKIKSKHKGFGQHSGDYMMVNLAIPVADAEQSRVKSLFLRVLERSFKCADELAGHPPLPLASLEQYGLDVVTNDGEPDSRYYVYPEVSANVQSFVRSPNASPGIYFFCDTGAATVDQCVFVFTSFQGQPKRLNYLSARVLPLGSGCIEREAMALNGEEGFERLEYWRRRKESNENDKPIRDAKDIIGKKLEKETVCPLFFAKRQLPVQLQFLDIKAIFGGGGHSREPYEKYTLDAFTHQNLTVPMPVADGLGRPPFRPDVTGMPIPEDLDLSNDRYRWYKRLTVAYGLSFFKGDLVDYQFPGAGEVAVAMPVREIPPAPGPEVL